MNTAPFRHGMVLLLFSDFFAVFGILSLVKLGIDAAGLQKLLMGATFGDPAVCNGHDPVCRPDGG